MSKSALYLGAVTHTRLRPAQHKLRYRVFMGLFDLSELPQLDRTCWPFSFNRTGLLSFQERDHGDGSGQPLRPQIAAALQDVGISCDGAIRVLCMPRLFNYVFNPLSVFFCFDRADNVVAIVHAVRNTFGERHIYALPVEMDAGGRLLQACDKDFRVSPFLPMNLKYQFIIDPPAEHTSVRIIVSDTAGVVLTACFAGERRPFTSWQLIRAWALHPALTLKVTAGIHWEAIWIWLKMRSARKLSERPG